MYSSLEMEDIDEISTSKRTRRMEIGMDQYDDSDSGLPSGRDSMGARSRSSHSLQYQSALDEKMTRRQERRLFLGSTTGFLLLVAAFTLHNPETTMSDTPNETVALPWFGGNTSSTSPSLRGNDGSSSPLLSTPSLVSSSIPLNETMEDEDFSLNDDNLDYVDNIGASYDDPSYNLPSGDSLEMDPCNLLSGCGDEETSNDNEDSSGNVQWNDQVQAEGELPIENQDEEVSDPSSDLAGDINTDSYMTPQGDVSRMEDENAADGHLGSGP